MKVFLTILFLAVSAPCFAGPYLVCNPAPEAIGLDYEVYNGQTLLFSGANEPDGSIRVDLKSLPVGSYDIKARYVRKQTAEQSEFSSVAYITATKVYISHSTCKPIVTKLKRR